MAWDETKGIYHKGIYFLEKEISIYISILEDVSLKVLKEIREGKEMYIALSSHMGSIFGGDSGFKFLGSVVGIYLTYVFKKTIFYRVLPDTLCIYPFLLTLFTCSDKKGYLPQIALHSIFVLFATLPFPFVCLLIVVTNFVCSCLFKFERIGLWKNFVRSAKSIYLLSFVSSMLIFRRDATSRQMVARGVQEALEYIRDVHCRFRDEPVVYKEFISLLSKVATKENNGNTVITKIHILLRGHDDLLSKFGDFVTDSV